MSMTYHSNSVQVYDELSRNDGDTAPPALDESVADSLPTEADPPETADDDVAAGGQLGPAEHGLSLADLADLAETEVDLDLADLETRVQVGPGPDVKADLDTGTDPDPGPDPAIDVDAGDCLGAEADSDPQLSADSDVSALGDARARPKAGAGVPPQPGPPAAEGAPVTEAGSPGVPADAVDNEADPASGRPAPATAPGPGYMRVGDRYARIDPILAASGFGYERYANLAGPITSPPADAPYEVQYRGIHTSRREWIAVRVITLVLVALDVRFMYWLIFQSQYPHLNSWLWQSTWHALATDSYVLLRAGMAIGSIVMQTFLLVNILTVSRACLAARDPLPVRPEPGLRVAFLTTIVPDREPIEVAERTLRAAREIVYDGKLDLWLLDEGDSAQARQMCDRLGVHHFSRKGRGYLDLESGTFASKTKHGNHNRWLWEHAGDYDLVMFVDPDHVPLPIMAERLLGYFRDPEVAFVVAPQFYGNTENRITRWAESAQYLFHSVIQRAGNRRRCPMLVGTNAAVRTSAIRQGYVASITEDMATSLKIHTTKSEVTGRAWRSVYTPDLVAVGEGPSTWTEFFGQQTRWSAGTYDALVRQVWRTMFRLRPGAMLHYFLMLTYYPSVAIGWLMGITISACYLGFGVSSLRTNEVWWLSYYVDVAAMQYLLYRFMRRHNVSPHEPAGSSGISGMVVSALTAPIYARALVKVLLGRKLTFNVTAKGASAGTDQLRTFRYSLAWALVPLIVLAIAIRRHRPYPMMIGWTAVILTVSLAPVAIWLWDRALAAWRERRRPAVETTQPAESSPEANLTSVAS
jgi:cellulose synthase/poly-beta-1,6-N-acetylglucosamine synthase-like glycosyltransferase